jgi:hypothetical protein
VGCQRKGIRVGVYKMTGRFRDHDDSRGEKRKNDSEKPGL